MIILPKPGTPEYAEFMRKAQIPGSPEFAIVRGMADDAAKQGQVRMQQLMQEVANQVSEKLPGQLFRDICRFHQKFGLPPTPNPGHHIPADMLKFRIKFLMEELNEYASAVGASIDNTEAGTEIHTGLNSFCAEDAFDALIDLVYVALGTAYLHRFPFNDGWARVQEKNMQKERAESDDDGRSKRGSRFDIVKPEGWTPPALVDLLDEECGQCRGTGVCGTELRDEPDDCGKCGGKGRVRRTCA